MAGGSTTSSSLSGVESEIAYIQTLSISLETESITTVEPSSISFTSVQTCGSADSSADTWFVMENQLAFVKYNVGGSTGAYLKNPTNLQNFQTKPQIIFIGSLVYALISNSPSEVYIITIKTDLTLQFSVSFAFDSSFGTIAGDSHGFFVNIWHDIE